MTTTHTCGDVEFQVENDRSGTQCCYYFCTGPTPENGGKNGMRCDRDVKEDGFCEKCLKKNTVKMLRRKMYTSPKKCKTEVDGAICGKFIRSIEHENCHLHRKRVSAAVQCTVCGKQCIAHKEEALCAKHFKASLRQPPVYCTVCNKVCVIYKSKSLCGKHFKAYLNQKNRK